MRKYEKICPICEGKGKIEIGYHTKVKRNIDNITMAKLLKKEGYSVRQIMRFLKYKSPRSVMLLLNAEEV